MTELKPKREDAGSDPSEPTSNDIALAQLTLLMRIYDVQVALLTEVNEARANEVYNAHENGLTFNPPIWIAEQSPEGQ